MRSAPDYSFIISHRSCVIQRVALFQPGPRIQDEAIYHAPGDHASREDGDKRLHGIRGCDDERV
eukprot:2713631-Pyramimonas_sp.AAC.1